MLFLEQSSRADINLGHDHGERHEEEHHADAWQSLPARSFKTMSVPEGSIQHCSRG